MPYIKTDFDSVIDAIQEFSSNYYACMKDNQDDGKCLLCDECLLRLRKLKELFGDVNNSNFAEVAENQRGAVENAQVGSSKPLLPKGKSPDICICGHKESLHTTQRFINGCIEHVSPRKVCMCEKFEVKE